jgi:inner membrane transporter RhtA
VSDPVGFLFAFANCTAFMVYVVLGHRIANSNAKRPATSRIANTGGIDQLAAAMLIAAVIATPIGAADAGPAFTHPVWLLWGAGVGVCSSVVPYVTDQLAMARMPRATFALMLALLPACAAIIGVVVLHQIPTIAEVCGIGLVILGLLLHRAYPATEGSVADPLALRPERRQQQWNTCDLDCQGSRFPGSGSG